MTNLFGSLDSVLLDANGMWCLGFDICESLNTRDRHSKDDITTWPGTVKFHMRTNAVHIHQPSQSKKGRKILAEKKTS